MMMYFEFNEDKLKQNNFVSTHMTFPSNKIGIRKLITASKSGKYTIARQQENE